MKIKKYSIYNALSYLIDTFEGNYLAHARHVAYTSVLIGKQLNYDSERLERLFYLSIMHDIGAGMKYGMKEHTEFGEVLIEKMGYDHEGLMIMRYHHEKLDGSGPFKCKGDTIPEESFIIHLANTIDGELKNVTEVNYSVKQDLVALLNRQQGLFPSNILKAAQTCVVREYFLLDYISKTGEIVFDMHLNFLEDVLLDYDEVKTFAEVFADVVDLRNPFTADHSRGIADKTLVVLNALDYDKTIKEEAYIAAILHDVGKIFVSNEILNKNGPLNEEERFEVNKHTYYTRWLLHKIEGFERITEWASNHHEKLDGSGYPYGLKDTELDEISRLIAIIDIYQALTETRPYRKAMPMEQVWSIIDEMVATNKLDGTLVDKIKKCL